ncbi:MAG: hypothetical protein KIS73_20450 [Enhydrobacter sp.]|nr:hypothetical protein [Enhydrobacter sp.]
MIRFIPLVAMLSMAGCTGAAGPDPNPLVWTATYTKPYVAMTYCLNAASADYRTVLGLDSQRGIGGVELIAPASGFAKSGKVGEFDVRRLTEQTSQVTFRSAIRTVGGSASIEDWARRQAESCAQ